MAATPTPVRASDPANTAPDPTAPVALHEVAPLDNPNDRHFRTEHLHADLKGRSVRGGAVTLGAQGVKLVLQIGSTAVLARLLTPHDYGLIAMVAVFTGLATMLRDLGLSMATVQRQHITHRDASTLFWVNFGAGLLLAIVTIVVAPLIARLYGEPTLTGIAIAIAPTMLFGGLAAQHTAVLRRQMRNSYLAFSDVMSFLIAIISAVLMALGGAGYWALVALIVIQALASAALVWIGTGWLPAITFSTAVARRDLTFGGHVSAYNVLGYIARNADNLLIGAILGPMPLGLYSRAYSLLLMPTNQIRIPLSTVAIPALSRLRGDPERYCRYYLQGLAAMMWLTGPAVALMAATAPHLVTLALGKQWLDAVPIFRILAITALLQMIFSTTSWVLISLGHTRRLVVTGLFTAAAFVASFTIGVQFGVTGVAYAYSAAFLCVLPWLVQFSISGTALTLTRIAAAVAYPIMFSCTLFLGHYVSEAFLRPVSPTDIFLALGLGACPALAFLVLTNARSHLWKTLSHLHAARMKGG